MRYRLKIIWNGFKETKDFVDCLCRALTCWTEGSATIAVLKDKLAVLECKEQAEKDRCAYVQEHPVDEVLTVYEKKCCGDPCPDSGDEDEEEDEEEEERERERRYREEEREREPRYREEERERERR